MSGGHRPFPEQIHDCLARCDHALQRGRPAEAMRYLALARSLRRLARELAQDDAPVPAPTAPEVTEVHEVHAAAAAAPAAPKVTEGHEVHTSAAAASAEPQVTEVHEVHASAVRIAELETRIRKRQRIGAPADDLRRELNRLRAQTPP